MAVSLRKKDTLVLRAMVKSRHWCLLGGRCQLVFSLHTRSRMVTFYQMEGIESLRCNYVRLNEISTIVSVVISASSWNSLRNFACQCIGALQSRRSMSFFTMFLLTTSSAKQRALRALSVRWWTEKTRRPSTPQRLSSVLHESQTRFRASSNVFRRVYCLRLAFALLGLSN